MDNPHAKVLLIYRDLFKYPKHMDIEFIFNELSQNLKPVSLCRIVNS